MIVFRYIVYLLGIPATEKFSFCLNTLLSDVAVGCPEDRDEIILNQVETLNILTNMLKSSKENSALPPIVLCKATVPLFLGLGRAMGRFASDEPPLLCRLFPRPEKPAIKPAEPIIQPPHSPLRQTSISQFRSIIPRSMSGSLSIDSIDGHSSLKYPRRTNFHTFYTMPYDATTHYFAKYGSSFVTTKKKYKKKHSIDFSIQHLQTIFAIAKKLLSKEVLEHLDEQASDIYSLNCIKSYGYKSFSETINLVLVTLLRELLQNQKGMCFLNSS